MPNHVINELVFRNIDSDAQEEILAMVRGPNGPIDFSTILPQPLNIWKSNVGMRHEEVFPGTGLNWNTANWGTKWNAYGIDEEGRYKSVIRGESTLVLTFQTAWRPPMGWIIAIFNKFSRSFEHNWLDEGEDRGHQDMFIAENLHTLGEVWVEKPASKAMQHHLQFLHGCESFDGEDEG